MGLGRAGRRPRRRHLAASFRPQADSLAAWLEDWLGRPPAADAVKQQVEEALLDNLRQTLAYWRAKSPAERAEMGLPEDGWEEDFFGHLGIDLSKL